MVEWVLLGSCNDMLCCIDYLADSSPILSDIEDNMSEIGLLKREIFSEGSDTVTMREIWDVRTPGCPLIVVRLRPFGQETDAAIVHRHVTYSKREPRPRVKDGGRADG